jgi:hypothetical protein
MARPDSYGWNFEVEVSSDFVKFGHSLEGDEFSVRLDQSKPTVPFERA